MPVVRVDIVEGKPEAYRRAIMRGVRDAVREAIGVPDERISQRLVQYAPDCLDVTAGRSDRYTVVEVSMLPGRTPEMKRDLFAAVQRNLGAAPGIDAHDIAVLIRDTPECDLCAPSPPQPSGPPAEC